MAKDFLRQIEIQKEKIASFKEQRADLQKRIKKAEAEINDIEKAMLLDAIESAQKNGCQTDTLLSAINDIAEAKNNTDEVNDMEEPDQNYWTD